MPSTYGGAGVLAWSPVREPRIPNYLFYIVDAIDLEAGKRISSSRYVLELLCGLQGKSVS